MRPRSTFFHWTIHIFFAGVLFFSTAHADDGVLRLTVELKEDLVALPRLVETGFHRDSLDDKHVVVTFFASWCPPCREEFKELNRFVDTNESKQVTILAVNLFEDWFGVDEARLERFLRTYSPRFHVVKGNEEIKRAFNNVDRIPTMFIFNPAGDMVEGFVHRAGAKKQHVTAEELWDMLPARAEN